MRKTVWVIVGLVVIAVVAAGAVALLHKRRVTAGGGSTATIDAELRANLPLGSSRADVESYLDKRAIQHSYVENSTSMPKYNRTEFAVIRGSAGTQLIRRDIQILFKFDEHDRLTEYSATEIYTGP